MPEEAHELLLGDVVRMCHCHLFESSAVSDTQRVVDVVVGDAGRGAMRKAELDGCVAVSFDKVEHLRMAHERLLLPVDGCPHILEPMEGFGPTN